MKKFFFDLLRLLPDKQYIQLQYFKNFGKFPNLHNPSTFNEKLQWLKLYDRQDVYTIMVDKYLVKEYVKEIIGEDFVIPTLSIYDDPSEINLDLLPEKFVLKWNHDSGSIIICTDKGNFNLKQAQTTLAKCQDGSKGYWYGREWPYKNIQKKLIAEQYLPLDENGDLVDYKLMCFNGKVKCIFTCTGRRSAEGLKVTFYDIDWNIMPFTRNHPAEQNPMPKPKSLDIMIWAAEQLSKDLPFARIDFYEIADKPLFGEITLYPGSGLEPFQPEEWDYTLGSWINLPVKK